MDTKQDAPAADGSEPTQRQQADLDLRRPAYVHDSELEVPPGLKAAAAAAKRMGDQGARMMNRLAAFMGLAAPATPSGRASIQHEVERARRGMLPPGKLPATEDTPLDPSMVARITVKARGKRMMNVAMKPGLGHAAYAALTALAERHGRHMVVTCHMRDGTKRRYRGNGQRTPTSEDRALCTPHRDDQSRAEPVAEPVAEPWRPDDVALLATSKGPVVVRVIGANATGSRVRYRMESEQPSGRVRSARPHRLTRPELQA